MENDGKQLRDILAQKENEVATARQTVLSFEREAQALREQVKRMTMHMIFITCTLITKEDVSRIY